MKSNRKRHLYSTAWFLTAICFLLCGLLSAAPAGEDETGTTVEIYTTEIEDPVADDTSFIEIHISPDGAYAVDSAGKEWEFDFTRDKFISDESKKSGTKTVFGRRKTPPAPPAPDAPDIADLKEEFKDFKKVKGAKFGAVVVDTDEKVRGPIVAVGDVLVRGKVIGDVISYEKITITSTGIITGNARAPEIEKMRGGVILGDRIERDFPEVPGDIEEWIKTRGFGEESYVALIVSIIIFVVLLICGLLVIALFSNAVNRVKVCIQKSYVKSFFVGLLIWIAYFPIMALLILTIIGIPIGLIALPILLLLGVILGIVGLSQLIGEKMSRYFGNTESQLVRVVLGISFLMVFWILMSLFMVSSGDVGNGFAILFLVLSIIIWSIGATTGLGAVILTRFGRRDCRTSIEIEIKLDGQQPPPPPTPPPLSSES